MEFGLPKVRQERVEKYVDKGVLTFMPTGEGKGRKVIFNKFAMDMLALDGEYNQISFSFTGKDIYIVNTSGCESCAGLKVGKVSKAFADKKHYDYIKTKMFGLKDEDELELMLEATENMFKDRTVLKVISMSKTEELNSEEIVVLENVDEQEIEIESK